MPSLGGASYVFVNSTVGDFLWDGGTSGGFRSGTRLHGHMLPDRVQFGLFAGVVRKRRLSSSWVQTAGGV